MQIALFERLPQSAEECLRAPLRASLQESAPPDLPQGAKSHPTVHLHNHLIRQFTLKNHILKVTKKECKDVPAKVCGPAIKHKREAEVINVTLQAVFLDITLEHYYVAREFR